MNLGMPPGWTLDPECLKAPVPDEVWCRGRWRVHRRMGRMAHTWGATYLCDDGTVGTLMTGGREAWWRSASSAAFQCDAMDSRLAAGGGFEVRVGRLRFTIKNWVNKTKA